MKDRPIRLTVGEGETRLHYEISFVGRDLLVLVSGGEAHIGSVAIAVPRQSLKDVGMSSATTSTINITGHKDDILTNPLAHLLAKTFGCTCIVTGGFHLDSIDKADMHRVMANSNQAASMIVNEITNCLNHS